MIVVSDTTPLISLLKINSLNILEKLFGKVLIPQAVFDELTVDERFKLEAEQIMSNKFVSVKPVSNVASVSILKRATGLDQGESEAIVLTDELKADLLLMDEAKGRTVSNQMGQVFHFEFSHACIKIAVHVGSVGVMISSSEYLSCICSIEFVHS